MSGENETPSIDEKTFWAKLARFAKKAGSVVVERALQLWYAAQRPETPRWAKTAIYGALFYFFSPVDALPDFAPLVGYTDDAGVLAAAVIAVAMYITPEVKKQASEKMNAWFGA